MQAFDEGHDGIKPVIDQQIARAEGFLGHPVRGFEEWLVRNRNAFLDFTKTDRIEPMKV